MVDKSAFFVSAQRRFKKFTRRKRQAQIRYVTKHVYDKQLMEIVFTLAVILPIGSLFLVGAFKESPDSASGLSSRVEKKIEFVSPEPDDKVSGGMTNLAQQQAEQNTLAAAQSVDCYLDEKTYGSTTDSVFTHNHDDVFENVVTTIFSWVMNAIYLIPKWIRVLICSNVCLMFATPFFMFLMMNLGTRRQKPSVKKQKRSNFLGAFKQTAKYLFAGRTRQSPLQLISAQRTRFADWRVSLRRERQKLH